MERSRPWARVFFCLGVSLLVSAGCTHTQRAYDGPDRPSSELSHLWPQRGSGSGHVGTRFPRFVSVDRWQINGLDVDVLPGLHEIIFEPSGQGVEPGWEDRSERRRGGG